MVPDPSLERDVDEREDPHLVPLAIARRERRILAGRDRFVVEPLLDRAAAPGCVHEPDYISVLLKEGLTVVIAGGGELEECSSLNGPGGCARK